MAFEDRDQTALRGVVEVLCEERTCSFESEVPLAASSHRRAPIYPLPPDHERLVTQSGYAIVVFMTRMIRADAGHCGMEETCFGAVAITYSRRPGPGTVKMWHGYARNQFLFATLMFSTNAPCSLSKCSLPFVEFPSNFFGPKSCTLSNLA